MPFEFLLISVAIPVLVVGIFYVSLADVGVNLEDEGYLLFGSKATADGKVPIRDFRAYDPGRYYWCALWIKCFGPRFIAIRYAMAFIMVLSVSLSASTLYLATMDWLLAGLSCVLFFVWMKPQHKQIEIFFSVLIIFSLYVLREYNFGLTFFILGCVVGAGGFFGINIFIYTGLSTGIALTILQPDLLFSWSGLSGLAWFAGGILLGLTPSLSMFLIYPGMLGAYWEKKIAKILRRGATNLALPLPWVWARHAPQLASLTPSRRWFFKFLFTVSPLIYGSILASYLAGPSLSDQHPMRLAAIASCAGLVYLHHVYSRADIAHLCQTIHPLLIAIVAMLAHLVPGPLAWASAALLVGLSAWAILPDFSERFRFLAGRKNYVRFNSGTESLWVHASLGALLSEIGRMIELHSSSNEKIFAGPILPGFYPLFRRAPAVYDIFSVYAASPSDQSTMIKELEEADVPLAIVQNEPFDGREDLRFSRNYPVVWNYLENNLHKLPQDWSSTDIWIFARDPRPEGRF